MISKEIFDPESTICAVSTPHGVGGIAVVRVSGPDAIEITDRIWRGKRLLTVASHTAHFGEIADPDRAADAMDECVATVYRAPNSFTGEDTVEISVHGSRWIQREVVALLVRMGCRPALPGEFTRRAVMNGRLDLTQAEAVADVIASSSRAAHRLAGAQLRGDFSKRISGLRDKLLELASLLELELDFSEEDVEFAERGKLRALARLIAGEIGRLHDSYKSGSAIKEGIRVVISGATNAGKSSLLNRILNDDRAIVSDIHGTTRDTIEESIEIDDFLFRFVDTAGLRDTSDPIERMGIDRSKKAIRKAHIVITVIDPTAERPFKALEADETPGDAAHILMINKSDLMADALQTPEGDYRVVIGSAKTGEGVETLIKELVDAARSQCSDWEEGDTVMVTNARQAESLRAAKESALEVINTLDEGLPPEFTVQHLRDTINHLSTITGTITNPEILTNIFKNFCIGK